MKTRIILISALMTAFAACNNADDRRTADTPAAPATVAANTEPTQTVSSEGTLHTVLPDSATVVANMTPGEKHKELAVSEGRWATEMIFWEYDGAKPAISRGTCDIKMVLGGRYQQSIYKADVNGVPFEGIGYVAYDNSKKMYVNTWIDNMGTGILYLEGNYSNQTGTTEMIGKCVDPETCRQKGMRQVTRNLDNGTQIMEMYETPDNGKEYKSMEIKFAKK